MIKKTTLPFLGICFGHELLGVAFGGEVRKISILKSNFEQIRILEPDPLLAPHKVDDHLMIAESHHKIVKPIPKDFKVLGETIEHHVEIMKHPDYSLYGIQGHPERATSIYPHGFRILENFLAMI
jgi:GMP synthase-like glutamine amidotransferase